MFKFYFVTFMIFLTSTVSMARDFCSEQKQLLLDQGINGKVVFESSLGGTFEIKFNYKPKEVRTVICSPSSYALLEFEREGILHVDGVDYPAASAMYGIDRERGYEVTARISGPAKREFFGLEILDAGIYVELFSLAKIMKNRGYTQMDFSGMVRDGGRFRLIDFERGEFPRSAGKPYLLKGEKDGEEVYLQLKELWFL